MKIQVNRIIMLKCRSTINKKSYIQNSQWKWDKNLGIRSQIEQQLTITDRKIGFLLLLDAVFQCWAFRNKRCKVWNSYRHLSLLPSVLEGKQRNTDRFEYSLKFFSVKRSLTLHDPDATEDRYKFLQIQQRNLICILDFNLFFLYITTYTW